MPPSRADKKCKSDVCLFAANGSKIPTYGKRLVSVHIGLQRSFRYPFIIADVTCPIIGADFLRHFSLMVDLKNRCLVDSVTASHVKMSQQSDNISTMCTNETHPEIVKLLKKYNIVSEDNNLCVRSVKHSTVHHNETKGPPTSDLLYSTSRVS
ncbi:hypothetical protein M8J77_025103 [Diaphorina citri]|nr:hypothetical protein M8J77_025103 [Diaphorina citri]